MSQGNENGFTVDVLAAQIAHLTEVIIVGQQAEEAWREEQRRWQAEDRQWKEDDRRWKETMHADLAKWEAVTRSQAESVDRLSRVAEILIEELRQKDPGSPIFTPQNDH